MTSVYWMQPYDLLFAMSRHAHGGDGRPPRQPSRPSRGSQSVQSVRRKLFGDVDHRQTAIDLDRERRQCEADDRDKYNFDFSSEQPIDSPDSRYQWSQSNDINDPEDNVSTNVCKIRDMSAKNIAQSSTQSAISSTPETEPRVAYKAVSRALGSHSPPPTPTPSATCAPDSQSQSGSSSLPLTSQVGQKHKSVTESKQKPITDYFDGRKSNQSQRKRSAAHERQSSTKESASKSKRHRLECASAVTPEDIDTTTDVRDTDVRGD